MSEHRYRPKDTMGENFVYSTSKLYELRSLSHGRQGKTYVGTFETAAGTPEKLVIKKFYGDQKTEIEDCHFLSQTAAKFREAGLPVLPLVKSVTTSKDVSEYDWGDLASEAYPVKPPYALMSFLKKSTKIARVLEFGSSTEADARKTLCKYPEQLENLVADIARINQLGYTRGVVDLHDGYGGFAGIGPHPIQYSWIFTQNKDDSLDRWLVDLNNFVPLKNLDERHQKVSGPQRDIDDLIKFFDYHFFSVMQAEQHYRDVYNSVRVSP